MFKGTRSSIELLKGTWTDKVWESLIYVVLQPLRWRCVECVIHHERDVRDEQQYVYLARISNNRMMLCAYAARAFPIATVVMNY